MCSFQHVVSREHQLQWVEAFYEERFKEMRVVSMHLVVMRRFVCTPAASLHRLSMRAHFCENQSADVCAFVSLKEKNNKSLCADLSVCVCVSPGFGVCVSDVNSLLSARFSTLPAAMKRARPSFPPPRGLISFFILSAIQLDFLWGHRRQRPGFFLNFLFEIRGRGSIYGVIHIM